MSEAQKLTPEEQKWADATMDNTKKWLVPSLRAAAGRVAESRAREGELVAAQNRVGERLRLASVELHEHWTHRGSWDDCQLVTCAGDKSVLAARALVQGKKV